MNLTLTISNIDDARQAYGLLRDYIVAHRLAQKRAQQGAHDEAFPETSTRTPLTSLELTVRAYNCLIAEGIDTVEKLCRKSRNELFKIPNLGRVSLDEIIDALAVKGHKLAG